MSKPAIIILHGWKLDSDKYSGLKKILEDKNYKVFAPDFPGFGKNLTLNRVYSLADYGEYLLNYIKKNNIKEPIVLIGHSFGGRVALVVGAKKPDLFKSLILTGVPGFLPASKLKISFFYYLAKAGKIIFSIWPLSLFANFFRKMLYKSAGAFDYYHTSNYLRDTFKEIIRTDLEPYMNKISIPTLLIWGENDQITPVWIAKKMNKNIRNSKLVIIPKENHSVVYKNPGLFTKYVL